MWICSKYGFFSMVYKNHAYNVRARVENDLQNLITVAGLNRKVITSETTDYPFRILIEDQEYQQVMDALADSVDYDNFKDMIDHKPDQKDKPYHEIWGILAAKYGSYVGWVNRLPPVYQNWWQK